MTQNLIPGEFSSVSPYHISFSVWFTTKAIYEVKCHSPENIVPFMCANGRVPYLNISPSRYYRYFLRNYTGAMYDYYY